LSTGASFRGFVPINMTASASSTDRRPPLNRYEERTSACTPSPKFSCLTSSHPSAFIRSLRSTIDSTSASFPAIARMPQAPSPDLPDLPDLSDAAPRRASAAVARAVGQSQTSSLPVAADFTIGETSLWYRSPSN